VFELGKRLGRLAADSLSVGELPLRRSRQKLFSLSKPADLKTERGEEVVEKNGGAGRANIVLISYIAIKGIV